MQWMWRGPFQSLPSVKGVAGNSADASVFHQLCVCWGPEVGMEPLKAPGPGSLWTEAQWGLTGSEPPVTGSNQAELRGEVCQH